MQQRIQRNSVARLVGAGWVGYRHDVRRIDEPQSYTRKGAVVRIRAENKRAEPSLTKVPDDGHHLMPARLRCVRGPGVNEGAVVFGVFLDQRNRIRRVVAPTACAQVFSLKACDAGRALETAAFVSILCRCRIKRVSPDRVIAAGGAFNPARLTKEA